MPDAVSHVVTTNYFDLHRDISGVGVGSVVQIAFGDSIFKESSYQYGAAAAGTFGLNAGFPEIADLLRKKPTQLLESNSHNGAAAAIAGSTGYYVASTSTFDYYFEVKDTSKHLIAIIGDYFLGYTVISPTGNSGSDFDIAAGAGITVSPQYYNSAYSGDGLVTQSLNNGSPGPGLVQNGAAETNGLAHFNIYTNTIYDVTLLASVSARAGALGIAVADPYFYIDPTVDNAPNYNFSLSSGVGNSAPVAVPEPNAWILAIAGFALVGSTLRRSRGPALFEYLS